MKYFIQLFLLLSFGLFIVSCEEDRNGRMPDDIKDSNIGVINVTESDPFINVSTPGEYSITMDVDLLFEGDFQQLELVVVMNGNYENQYVLETITSVPQSITVTSQDIVDAVDGLSSTDDIVEGDVFELFTNITLTDGTYVPGYTKEGIYTVSPTVANVISNLKGGSASARVTIPVPCEFILEDYLGVMDADEFWAPDLYEYQVEIIENPDYTGDKIGLRILGIWDGTWTLDVEVDTYDYSVTAEAQLMAESVFGYTNPVWSNIYGTVETCDKALVVNIGRFCVDAGCFGGMPITYTFTKAEETPSKKSAALKASGVPAKIAREVE